MLLVVACNNQDSFEEIKNQFAMNWIIVITKTLHNYICNTHTHTQTYIRGRENNHVQQLLTFYLFMKQKKTKTKTFFTK